MSNTKCHSKLKIHLFRLAPPWILLYLLDFLPRFDSYVSFTFSPHHHHHHLFLKRPFLPRSARVRRFSRYEASPHIPEHCPFRVQTKLIRIILYTFSPSLSAPTHTSHPCHHHISTGRHPIISTLMFLMLKPPQSIMPHQSPPQPCSEHPKDCTRPHFSHIHNFTILPSQRNHIHRGTQAPWEPLPRHIADLPLPPWVISGSADLVNRGEILASLLLVVTL